MNNHFQNIKEKILKKLDKINGDLFEIYIYMYDLIDSKCIEKKEKDFYKKIFESIKSSEEYLFASNVLKVEPELLKTFYSKINKEKLNIKNEEELDIIFKMLFTITRRAIVMRFKYKSTEEARYIYIKELEFLKYGILKK